MNKPRDFMAVMENRAPAEADERDFFPTPPWAARAGGELIRWRIDPDARTCWEPAAGQGHMAHGLGDYFDVVYRSDIEDHDGPLRVRVLDFLGADADGFVDQIDGVDWIVTNPPFVHAEAFVRLGLRRARRGVAMLCRLSFLETVDRYDLHYGRTPLTVCAPFAERVPMAKGKWDPKGSTATAYAWFFWRKPALGDGGFVQRLIGIAPGTRDRLTRQSDVATFRPDLLTGGAAGPDLFAGEA